MLDSNEMPSQHVESQCATSRTITATTSLLADRTRESQSIRTPSKHRTELMLPSPVRLSLWAIVLLATSLVAIGNCDEGQQQQQQQQPPHFTNEFAVHLKNCQEGVEGDGDDVAQKVADRYGFINHGKIGSLDCHFLFSHHRVSKRSLDYAHQHHVMLAADDEIRWVEQQKVLSRKKRDNSKSKFRYSKPMNDPIYSDMWYMHKGALGGYDMNVENAWKRGYTGKGVVVTILDDGIQMNHPELARNYDAQASYDINDNDSDPTPQDNGDNKHGTRCAGEVAAEAYNGFCGVGIAFNASIGGVRMLDGVVTDQVEAKAISHNPNHIDIYSASWGPEDDGKTVDGPGKLAKRAFVDGIKKGRHGRGSIFVWASGNGGRRLDNCNCDGYTNSIYTLSISSATQHGNKPWYLEECSSTLSTTYSSGTPGKDQNILTCDQDTSYFKAIEQGEAPQKESLCTRSHTGTSASAPIAAAIFALALEANPKLTWRDVQHLTIISSRYEPLRHEKGWTTNGVDRKVSHKFGYGLMDAEAIVRHAEKWTNVPAQRICETPSQNKEKEIPAQARQQLEATLLTNGCRGSQNEIRYLEHVQTKITLKYQPRGSLRISLISPSGTITNLLYPRPRDTEEVSFNSWPFLSVHFWGEKPTGYWRLVIQNDGHKAAIVPGKLFSWSLIFYGTYEKPVSSVYNESSRYYPRSTSPATTALNECAQKGLLKQYDSEECVSNCSAKQWANRDIGQCMPCHNVCDSCFGPSSDNCLSCTKGYFHEYHCLDSCPDGYFGETSLKECLPCSGNCSTCSSAQQCVECRKNYKLDQDEGGASRCIAAADVIKPSAQVNCTSNCARCSATGSNQCLACEANYLLFENKCVPDKCPDGAYLAKVGKSSECFKCHHSCQTCDGPSHQQCASCFKNATLHDKTCHFCLPGHFMNQETMKCESCHSTCVTCSGPLANDCLTCREGLFIDNSHCVRCCQTDRPRSVKVWSDRLDYKNTAGGSGNGGDDNIVEQMFASSTFWLVAFLIVIACLVVGLRRAFQRKTKLPSYQKLNSSYTRRRRNRRNISDLDDIYDNDDDDDDDEDDQDGDEVTLFEKT